MRWPTPALGSLVETIVPARDKPENLDGPIPWLRIEDFDGRYISTSSSGQGVTPETVAAMNLRVFPKGTVVCTCSCTMGTTAIVKQPLITNQTFIGLLPRDERLLSEYLYWALQAYRDDLNAQATGAIQQYLSRDDFRQLRIPIPPVAEQRAIADYLDAETTRIDALIAKKRQLVHLLEERRWRTFDELAVDSSSDLVPLRRVLTFLTDGPFGSAFSSADYVEAGLAVIRLGNIGFAEFRAGQLAYLPLERQAEFSRYRARTGDLLVAALGDERSHAGRACVAPDLGPAIVKGKCFCGRVDFRVADVEYVALACSSPSAAERFRLGAQGTTRQMINLEIFKSFRIPLPSLDQQRRAVADVRRAWRTLDEAIKTIARQLDLLAEHRQAHIAAAVTGEFRVPAAA